MEENPNDLKRKIAKLKAFQKMEKVYKALKSYDEYEDEIEQFTSFDKKMDDTITLHQRKLDKLKQLKQGYLQQLFPNPGETVPKIRFANFEGEWEERKLRTLLIKNSKKIKI
nr:hypothetical protein [Lactococcus petauri]